MSDNEKELLDIPDRVRNQHLLNIELREQLSASRQEVEKTNKEWGIIVEALKTVQTQQVDELREALGKAKQFIENGIEFGYITMPDKNTPDSAHEALPAIIKALSNQRNK